MNSTAEKGPPLLLSDLGVCEPSSSISPAGVKDHWRLIDYETETGLSGRMLYSGEEGVPEDISMPLDLKGWHRIYVGLGATNLLCTASPPGVRLKLDQDPCYVKICSLGSTYWLELREYFWKEACLDGDRIHFAKVKGSQSCVAYVRFEPMSDEEIEHVKARRMDKEGRCLTATNDSEWEYNSVDEIFEIILPLKDSPVRKLFFCIACGDVCYYMDTKVGSRLKLRPGMECSRSIDRRILEALDNLNSVEPDVLGRICDFTHEIGLEFHASFRVGAFANQPPHDAGFRSEFFTHNPQFRCRDRDGREIARMSYAFEEVQNHMLDLYEETLGYDIDGLNLIFVRALPMMLYEEPLLIGFRNAYGKNPLELDEHDPDFLAYRAGVLTEFMRRVRTRVDTVRQKQGRGRIPISAICAANERVNTFFGLDLKTWAEEGIVDIIAPDFSLQGRDHDDWDPDTIDIDYFLSVVAGTDCQLLPRLPHYAQQDEYAEYFRRMRNCGVRGMYLWDAEANYFQKPEQWAYIRTVGDADSPDEVRAPKRILLKSLGDFVTDKYPAHSAF